MKLEKASQESRQLKKQSKCNESAQIMQKKTAMGLISSGLQYLLVFCAFSLLFSTFWTEEPLQVLFPVPLSFLAFPLFFK